MEEILELLKERFTTVEYKEEDFGCYIFTVYSEMLSKTCIEKISEKANLYSWMSSPTNKGLKTNLYFTK